MMSNDDDGVWCLHFYVTHDELMVIMRCSIVKIQRLILFLMISTCYVIYVYDGSCLWFNC